MDSALKVLVGALMIAVGVFSTVSFSSEVLALVKAAAGPLLVLVGAFIVWLESEEFKEDFEEEVEETEERKGLQREFQPQQAVESDSSDEDDFNAEEVLSGTVREVKDEVRSMEDPDYEALLEAEEQGKDRKTLKDFLERRVG